MSASNACNANNNGNANNNSVSNANNVVGIIDRRYSATGRELYVGYIRRT